ncbi:MAG: hypothetical protein CVT88_05755 [Candidatus Altiarchaeales archaeon HGW-Altiarchaeales-1]|nr:MAG: hypothetical protein CVT88_05755 [Candidatus Altiarchaeales archaeon HGW-Altiarchaeales-1]
MSTIDSPTDGKIYIYDREISKMSDDEKAILRRKIFGFVFQQFNLINSLTVLENVVMPMRFENLNSKKAEERGKFLIKQVGLDGKENNKISEISGGQMQRVACVLVKNPKVLFLDEPTSGLDPTGKMDIQILLKKLSEEGMTIFYCNFSITCGKMIKPTTCL